jgi:hypothetical protein
MIASDDFKVYLEILSQRLSGQGINAEIILFGGGAMSLLHAARMHTQDLDVYYRTDNKDVVEAIAKEVAQEYDLEHDWINDAARGYLTPEILESARLFLDYPALVVYVISTEALLAMKMHSMRIGAANPDYEDARFLLKKLKITSLEEALELAYRFYPKERGRLGAMQIIGTDTVIKEINQESKSSSR